ncbi:PAS domain-containing protein [Marinibaculum pumilum]|uniref:PAS domain-containing protein n=1 Tax=Marinibaculum pumilum TaxID=1766165 RepID=A0ABV7L0M9_9PROT
MTAPLVLQGQAYWRSKCHNGRLPGRADIVPSEIKSLLPHVILSEVLRDPFDIRFRLVGTKVVEMNNVDLTGKRLNHGVTHPGWQDYWLRIYTEVAETGRPAFGADSYEYRDRDHAAMQWCLLPLASDGRTVDMIFEIEEQDPAPRPGDGHPLLHAGA